MFFEFPHNLYVASN